MDIIDEMIQWCRGSKKVYKIEDRCFACPHNELCNQISLFLFHNDVRFFPGVHKLETCRIAPYTWSEKVKEIARRYDALKKMGFIKEEKGDDK